jgi:hypothetical protein
MNETRACTADLPVQNRITAVWLSKTTEGYHLRALPLGRSTRCSPVSCVKSLVPTRLSLCNVACITSSSTSRCQMVSPRVSLHQATSSSSKEIKLHATERGHEPHQDPPTNVADPSLPSGGRRLAVAGAAVAGQPRGRSKLQSFSFFASRSSESPCRRLQPAKVRRRPLQGRQEVLAHRFQPAAQLMIVHSQEFTGAIYRR